MPMGDLGKIYLDGEIIVRQGEVGDCMYVLLGGKVQVLAERPNGDVALSVLEPGSIFGEMALFSRTRRSATVRAVGEARVLTVNKRQFLSNIHEDPSLAFRILQQMSTRIQDLSTEIARLRGAPDDTPRNPAGAT